MQDFAPWVPWIGGLLGLLCLAGAFRAGRLRRLVENLPTSKTTGVFVGLVEVQGTAESAQPLASYLAAESCVWYQWSVDEHWSRTVTETYTDSEGKTQTRTRHESGWTTVINGGQQIPFYLQDDCGVVLVRPEGARIEPAMLFDEMCTPGDELYYAKGPAGAVANSDHRRRFYEQGIRQHAALYVMGQARERQDLVAAEIAEDAQAPMFLISTRSEEAVRSGMKWGQYGWALAGLVLVVAGVVASDALRSVASLERLPLYLGAGAIYLAIGGMIWVWMVYNSLVDLRQRVRRAWTLIDIQLKRRHDLIPNLVRMVQGYTDYERRLQNELAALRSQLDATPPGRPGPDFGALGRVALAIAESYPDLKANEPFLALQKSLIDTEQRIALARGYFNEIAMHYNTRLELVPERYVAALAGMGPETTMEANEFERAPVRVDLAPR